MRNRIFLATILSVVLVGAGCTNPLQKSNATSTTTPTNNAVAAPANVPDAVAPTGAAPVVTTNTIVVSMRPKGGENESGTATFTKVDGNHTRVVIKLANAEMASAEEAGLYVGSCASVSATPQYDLAAVIRGKSETVLNVNFSSFVGGTVQSVRVFTKPLNAQSSYWVCGDVK